MKQNVTAIGKFFLVLTITTLTYCSAIAQNSPTHANIATATNTQKFQAIAINNSTVTISWQTNTQFINQVDIELERSFDMADFKTICFIMAPENGDFAVPTCAFKDKQAMQQQRAEAYYRLKQVDKSGNVTYSEVVTVKLK